MTEALNSPDLEILKDRIDLMGAWEPLTTRRLPRRLVSNNFKNSDEMRIYRAICP